jgi:hypothetical protein
MAETFFQLGCSLMAARYPRLHVASTPAKSHGVSAAAFLKEKGRTALARPSTLSE